MSEGQITRGDVARGAGLAGLARAGALIEIVAQPLYTWMFGLATYGLYVVLWGAINFTANLVDLSMTSALQRVIPTEDSEERAHGAVKFSLLVSVIPSVLIALLVTLNSEAVAGLFSAAPEDAARLPRAVALFAWGLPLWTFVEVATSAARARRAFGPEIRLRIFWEQLARLFFAILFFAIGLHSTGLMIAHLCSLVLTAGLCLPLLGRYYNLRRIVSAPIPRDLAGALLSAGLSLLPTNLVRRLLIDAPPVVLNLLLPGARGAAAAGLFEIARRISTVTYFVRQAFQYVLAPLSSAQAHIDRAAIAPLFGFASRVSTALVVPVGGLLIFAGKDILSVYREEAAAALPLLWILVIARTAEAIVGPANTIVEMIGHRGLPILNSLIGAISWAVLALLLTPIWGGIGMAIAVGIAIVASSYAAMIELRISDGLSPIDRKFFQGFALALLGVAAMAAVEWFADGPVRFVSLLIVWLGTSWATMRLGLGRQDREALGSVGRRLRLVR